MRKLIFSSYWYKTNFIIIITAFSIGSLIFFHCMYLLSIITMQIIDSIMALFRVDFSGRGELAERQQKLAQMLSRLQKISEGERNMEKFRKHGLELLQ